jgi:DNA-binding transcriptional regulator YiaG
MKKCPKCKSNIKSEVFKLYEDKLLGIPGVYIKNAVVREFCPKCRHNQSIIIPNLQGLIAAVAVHRINQPLKLSPREILFLRKACEWTARTFAGKLEVRPETVSRWENGKETMSPQSEKLLRLIVGDKLHRAASAITFDPQFIGNMRLQSVSQHRLIMCFCLTRNADQGYQEQKRFAYG